MTDKSKSNGKAREGQIVSIEAAVTCPNCGEATALESNYVGGHGYVSTRSCPACGLRALAHGNGYRIIQEGEPQLPAVISLKVGCPLDGFRGRKMQIVGQEELLAVKTNGAWREPKPGMTINQIVFWLQENGYRAPTCRNIGRDDRLGMAVREMIYKRRPAAA